MILQFYRTMYWVRTMCCTQERLFPPFLVSKLYPFDWFFSSPEQRSGRAIVLPLTSGLALALVLASTNVKVFVKVFKTSLLAHLNNVQEELLYYPWRRRWRRHPQKLKFSLKFLRPHYFLTLSPIWFFFGMMIHIGPKFCAVPSPPL